MKRIFLLAGVFLFLLSHGSAYGADGAPTSCPGTSVNASAKLSSYLVCKEEEKNADCRAFPGAGGKEFKLKTSSRLDMGVKNAEAISDKLQTLYIKVQLDQASSCWFHKVTAEHNGEMLALVVDGTVMVAPVIREAIPNGQLQVLMASGATMAETIDICRKMDPACEEPSNNPFKKVGEWLWPTK